MGRIGISDLNSLHLGMPLTFNYGGNDMPQTPEEIFQAFEDFILSKEEIEEQMAAMDECDCPSCNPESYQDT